MNRVVHTRKGRYPADFTCRNSPHFKTNNAKGKPVKRQGRKAIGSKVLCKRYDSLAANCRMQSLSVYGQAFVVFAAFDALVCVLWS